MAVPNIYENEVIISATQRLKTNRWYVFVRDEWDRIIWKIIANEKMIDMDPFTDMIIDDSPRMLFCNVSGSNSSEVESDIVWLMLLV